MSRRFRLAYLVSHPIQYQAPLLRYVTERSDIDLSVMFLSDFSVRGYQDPGFGAAVEWDVPLLEGYDSSFLPALGGTGRVSPLRPFVYGIGRRLRQGRFDALWMHGYAHQANLRALVSAKAQGIRVFVRAESQMNQVRDSVRTRRIKEPILRRLFGAVDAFLTIGTWNRDYYQHYGARPEKLFPVPYAVDNEFFQTRVAEARPRREALRAALSLAPNRPVVLYASKFQRRKRASDLLEAYARLSPDGVSEPHPYLLLAGDGEERPALEERARQLGWPSIRFLGFKNQTELPGLFDLCDVFVLPSEAEPWGLIVNEVMNAAKPVIVTDQVGAAPDLVADGDNGFVVPVGDLAALSNRLARLVSSPDEAARMGARSLERINHWGFREDLQGIQSALEATVTRRESGR